MSQLRTACSLAFALLLIFEAWSSAQAQDVRSNTLTPLPLNLDAYKAFVQQLATEMKGDEAAMATKLRALGFSCTQVSKSIQFTCVRFGCQKRNFWWGSLLEWTVQRGNVESPELAFSGGAINYSGWARCIPEKDREQAQQRFLSSH
ncbi:hypothetical protein [Rhizobium sp. WYJ-E13]|uniref:hypothetical protein n=1 Tax=unclassified Rhizobium TaxID=2613769 RepID=UPI001C1F1AE3|nr:hypothetical protein [Rhizobium sp. WYJ-E13]QWW69679.1 hypothetical protein KQ933_08225 [Rhizobium sp. WYJ-E13]